MEENQIQIGGRIRRLRRQKRITQQDLAGHLGISPSYLNLIEHNRRSVTVPILFSLAGYFGVEPGDLAESDDQRLTGDLMEMFGDDLFADTDVTNFDIKEFARSQPGVARAVLRLFDAHSRQLAEVAQGGRDEDGDGAGPVPFHRATDLISDFLQEHANHFPTLEEAAERVRADIDNAADSFEAGLRTYLINVFGMDWRFASLPHGVARRLSRDGRMLELSELLSQESALFSISQHIAGLVAAKEIEALIGNGPLSEGDAPALAHNVFASYFAAALMMPYPAFLKACKETRYDVDRLSRRFGTSFEQVCHRMTTLQRPGAQGIPFHLIRTDIAGNISKRFSLSGIHIPRHAGACPRWNVYLAFLQPGRINTQISRMPNGDTFFCIARSFEKGGHRYNAPRRHFSIGLGCDVAHARELVYADGVDLSENGQITPVGVSCRICPRLECDQRAHPPADHRFHLEDETRAESLYARIG